MQRPLEPLKATYPDEVANPLVQRLRSIWTARADRHSEARTADTAPTHKIEMSYIGG